MSEARFRLVLHHLAVAAAGEAQLETARRSHIRQLSDRQFLESGYGLVGHESLFTERFHGQLKAGKCAGNLPSAQDPIRKNLLLQWQRNY